MKAEVCKNKDQIHLKLTMINLTWRAPRAREYSKIPMGVQYLSKKLRKSDDYPESLAKSKYLKEKQIGVDASVILHKGIGTQDGAREFRVQPMVLNSEVIDKVKRIYAFAKRNNITLAASINGKYHLMKEREKTANGRTNKIRPLGICVLI